MTIVGDMKYLQKHRGLSNISPNNIPADFSGMIFYKRFSGKFLKGWFYEKGKASTRIKWYKKPISTNGGPNGDATTNDAGDPPCLLCYSKTNYKSTDAGCQSTTNGLVALQIWP